MDTLRYPGLSKEVLQATPRKEVYLLGRSEEGETKAGGWEV